VARRSTRCWPTPGSPTPSGSSPPWGEARRADGVGTDGASFGVANNTTLTVYSLLLAVNSKAVNGVLYNGNATMQAQAADLYNALNQAGSIG
jgi:hypothetical protein